MQRITSREGLSVSYERYGAGPSLVLVHGAFSDHRTNWEFVKPLLEKRFTVYALARRGRGETDGTEGHSLEDESSDVVAVIQSIAEPVFLLGRSYGAQTALAAATKVPRIVRKLVLYEAAWPRTIGKEALARLEGSGESGQVGRSRGDVLSRHPVRSRRRAGRTAVYGAVAADRWRC